VVSYLTLMSPAAAPPSHDRREGFTALRWVVRAGAPWQLWPNDLPPWTTVDQQPRRGLAAGCFGAIVHDR
jgi:transposase